MSTRNFFSKIAIFTSVVLVISTLLAVTALAYPSHTDYISDGAVILDESTENAVKTASKELEKSKNTRIAVCTVLNTGDEDIKDYAAKLFKNWKIGNGVLIVLSIEDDTFYAVQSNSVADVLTSKKLSEILNTSLEPSFAAKEYSEGTLSAANALSVFLSNNLPEDFGEAKKATLPKFVSVILKAVIIIAIILIAGYAALIIAEKRKAQKDREEMESRRRMIASGATYPSRRPQQNTRRAPANTQRAPYQNTYNAPSQRNGAQRPAPQNRPTPQRRPSRAQNSYDVSTAATIQINTADIRAAKQAQNKRGTRR